MVLLEKSEGNITHANPATENMLGYTKEESIGNKLQDIGVSLGMDDFATTMQTLNKSGIINYRNINVETKSGQHIDTEIYLKGRSMLFNKRFGELWMIPQHILDTKDDTKMLECVLKQLKGPEEFGRKVAYLYEHRDEKSRDEIEFADGRYLDRYSSPLIGTDGQHLGRIWFFRDITERKLAEEDLKQTMEKLRKTLAGTVHAMSMMVETRDPYTAGHQRKVSNLARVIAQEMGLSKDTVDTIRMAGSIHDIGKISVPAEILSKPGKLKDMEFNLIKAHPQAGYDMLKEVELPYPIAEI
ncbi:MAG: PAS domain S-box protein, partial [Bacteroidales bacterium]|nr:PAS domain S-box protein [Bacteroidales bacterium]